MQGLKFAENFSSRRKQLGMTQGDVAAYVGVSNAAVSKWEQGISYPDLSLLPKLATLLDVTIDALLGYEPQLTRAKIIELYQGFAKRMSEESFEQVQADIEAMLKEYYACYPFLIRIAQLYLNYYINARQPELVLQRIVELCERTVTHSGDYQMSQEAHMLHASVLLLSGKPQELLQHLGEGITIEYGTDQMIAQAHAMLGDMHKAQQMLQASVFQNIFSIISSETERLTFEVESPQRFDETVRRIEQIMKLYNTAGLNIHMALMFYYKAARGYMQQQRPKEALRMLECYYRACEGLTFPIQIRGDHYFDLVNDWIAQNIHLGPYAPRDEQAIKKDMLKLLQQDPSFVPLHDDPAFKALITNLRHVLKLKEENP